jgi:hypothetical protein
MPLSIELKKKKKMDSEMHVKTQEITSDYSNKIYSLESRISDTQGKLENMQLFCLVILLFELMIRS